MENTNQTANAPRNPQTYIELADNTYLSFMKDGRYRDIVYRLQPARLGVPHLLGREPDEYPHNR